VHKYGRDALLNNLHQHNNHQILKRTYYHPSILLLPHQRLFSKLDKMKDLLTKSILTERLVIEALAPTVQQLANVAKCGGDISEGITNVYMVSSGGGLHIKTGIQWWCKAFFGSKANVQYETYDAADFLSLPMIDTAGPETLVLLTSKSGSTAEALAVGARLKRAVGCKVVCFTQSKKSKIVQYGVQSYYTGDTPQSFHATLMLLNAFVGGIWEKREGWGHLDKLLSSLGALPTALAKAALASQSRDNEFVDKYNPTGIIYFIAAGPMQFVGKAFGNCVLEEMLELGINVFPANHFYHSLVEKMPFKDADRVIFLPGLDSTRWQLEQPQRWCVDHNIDVDVYDACEFDMGGIHKLIQPMLAPIVVEAALKPMAEPLSRKTKDLDTRKYMGKEKFWDGSEIVTEKPAFAKVNEGCS
jgi:fructoselysine 6-phosphate deglycase